MTKEERELRRQQRERQRELEMTAREAGRGPLDVPFLLLTLSLIQSRQTVIIHRKESVVQWWQ